MPVAFITVSNRNFGGTQAITALPFALWKIGALSVPGSFRIPNVQDAFDEKGNAADKKVMDKNTSAFIDKMIRFIDMIHLHAIVANCCKQSKINTDSIRNTPPPPISSETISNPACLAK
jgi:hypothetical protein